MDSTVFTKFMSKKQFHIIDTNIQYRVIDYIHKTNNATASNTDRLKKLFLLLETTENLTPDILRVSFRHWTFGFH